LVEDIGNRIITLINATGLTNNSFAAKIGTSSAVISHITTGRNKPNLELIYKITKVYTNVNIEWLILGKSSMQLDPNQPLDGKPSVNQNKPTEQATEEPQQREGSDISNQHVDSMQIWEVLEEMLQSQRDTHKNLERQLTIQSKMMAFLKSYYDKR